MSVVQRVLTGHVSDLGGGMQVRRLLPAAAQRAIGPFVFFDHMGPLVQLAGGHYDVRPHPHIGLATVTYLFEGAMMHRDSLGHVQRIEPGAINWMSAGRGIVHSERTPEDLRALDRPLHGLQLWVALPRAQEESEPSFTHTPAQDLPLVQSAGVSVRVLAGALGDARSPVRTASPTVYLDVAMTRGSRFDLPPLAAELGVYVVQGQAFVNAQALNAHELGVLTPQAGDVPTRIEALDDARLAIIGGEPLDAPRHIWWNFVSSRKERIREAAEAWAADRLGHIEGDTERIPLPDRPLA